FDLMMHVALALPYRGRRVHAGTVVYLALEGGDGFRARIEAFRQQHNVTDAPFFLITDRADLIKDHAALIADIRKQIGDWWRVVIVTARSTGPLPGSESKAEARPA